jgi:hypothetical protein
MWKSNSRSASKMNVAHEIGRLRSWHGLIGKMNAVPGKRDDLIAIVLVGVTNMPGCLSYIVARDL